MAETGCDIVVVGASAGGVETLGRFVRALPRDFAAPVLIVLHVSPTFPSVLPSILDRAGPLPALHGEDDMVLEAGRIYVAPPDRHMRVARARIRLDAGPREKGHRPAINPLFCSAADAFEHRAAGVVLSGTLDDGAIGLHSIKQAGGATLAQAPDDALYPAMPANAIAYAKPDYVLPVEELVATLVRLTKGSAGSGPQPSNRDKLDAWRHPPTRATSSR